MLGTDLALVSDGTIKVDGGSLFGRIPKGIWETQVKTDRQNRVTLGLNCLLLRVGGRNILLETGVGPKDNLKDKAIFGLVPSRLMRALKANGLGPRDIDAVILSHGHIVQAGGATRMDRMGHMGPSFPRATYYIQRAAWEDALAPSLRQADLFRADDLQPLVERGQLELLDGDQELFPGLNLLVTNGHCQGHQIAIFSHGGERVAFLAGLVPTPYHLRPDVISAFDLDPEATLDQKQEILADAERRGWLLVFSHGNEVRAGYLERRGDLSHLRPVEL